MKTIKYFVIFISIYQSLEFLFQFTRGAKHIFRMSSSPNSQPIPLSWYSIIVKPSNGNGIAIGITPIESYASVIAFESIDLQSSLI